LKSYKYPNRKLIYFNLDKYNFKPNYILKLSELNHLSNLKKKSNEILLVVANENDNIRL